MKKLMSFSMLCALLGALFAFAPKAELVDSWLLYNGQVVQGSASTIKSTYCPGPDNRTCATQIGGSGVIFRP